jgi:hypothetical protein
MKRINTKLVAVLLTFVLTFSLMSIAAAAEKGGNGDTSTPAATSAITYNKIDQALTTYDLNGITINNFIVVIKQASNVVSCWTAAPIDEATQNEIKTLYASNDGSLDSNKGKTVTWEFHALSEVKEIDTNGYFKAFTENTGNGGSLNTMIKITEIATGGIQVLINSTDKISHLDYGTYTPATTSSSPTPTESTTTSQSPAPTESATTSQSPAPTESATTSQSPAPTESATTSQSPAPTESATTSQSPAPTESATTSQSPAPTESATPSSSPAPTTVVPPTNPSATPSAVPVIPGVIETPTTIVDETPPAAEPSITPAETDPTTSAEVDIQEPEVPLADASQQVTGDSVVIWVILAVLSGTALVYTIVYDYKHSEKN